MAVKYPFIDSLYYHVSSANDLCICIVLGGECIFRNIEYDMVKMHYVSFFLFHHDPHRSLMVT